MIQYPLVITPFELIHIICDSVPDPAARIININMPIHFNGVVTLFEMDGTSHGIGGKFDLEYVKI